MPEGDTIYRAAVNLRKVLQQSMIESVTGRPEVQRLQDLTGSIVTGIESRGKHLIFHFSNELVLHSHMGMTGAWHIYPADQSWQKPESQAVAVLKTASWCVVCFTPKQIRVITQRQLLRDAYLQTLGPDLLGPAIEDQVILQRFRSQNAVAIGEVIMNQTVVCGIGNVYKSEILFAEQLHPLTSTGNLTGDQVLSLRDRAVFMMQRNLDGRPRQTRFRSDGQKLWVYGRRNQQCLKCGTTIEMIRQGNLARSTYFCPVCQPPTIRAAQ